MKKVFLLSLACLLFTSCGVKPSEVDPPEGSDGKFPRTYPDIDTDPK